MLSKIIASEKTGLCPVFRGNPHRDGRWFCPAIKTRRHTRKRPVLSSNWRLQHRFPGDGDARIAGGGTRPGRASIATDSDSRHRSIQPNGDPVRAEHPVGPFRSRASSSTASSVRRMPRMPSLGLAGGMAPGSDHPANGRPRPCAATAAAPARRAPASGRRRRTGNPGGDRGAGSRRSVRPHGQRLHPKDRAADLRTPPSRTRRSFRGLGSMLVEQRIEEMPQVVLVGEKHFTARMTLGTDHAGAVDHDQLR